MKPWLTRTVLAAALALPGGLALAQAAPEAEQADTQEAKAKLELKLQELAEKQKALGHARLQVARPKTEKAAWLGVSTSQVPTSVRQHLKLKNKYIGLVVDRVEPDSPADAAGLEQFDIIEKVNDQWIVNTQQFSVVLRMQKPGDAVTLSVIRQGLPQELKATLAEKDLPVLAFAGGFNFEMVPMPADGNLFEMGPEGAFVIRGGAGMDHLIDLTRLDGQKNSSLVVKDDQHTLKITTAEGQRTLVASDANGVVIFDGPIDTEEEFAEVPDEIRAKVKKLDLPGGSFLLKGPTTGPSEK